VAGRGGVTVWGKNGKARYADGESVNWARGLTTD